METIRPIPESEKTSKMSFEEAKKLLEERRPLPKNAIRNFGPSVEAFVDILHDPEICELDAMQLSGQMTQTELEEYVLLFPEAKETKKELRAYADNLYKKIAPTIPKIVRSMFTKDKQSIKSFQPIEDLMNTLINLVHSQELSTQSLSHRSFQLEILEANLLEKCSVAIYNHTEENYGIMAALRVLQYLSQIQREAEKNPLSQKKEKLFSGAKIVHFKIAGKSILQNHRETAQEVFEKLPLGTEGIASPENFSIIEDLSHIKKIQRTRIETPHALLLFYNLRTKNPLSIASIVICFDKQRIRIREGNEKLPLDECIVLNLDRSSGELLIAGTQQTGKLVLGEKRYHSFKNFIYKRLLEDFGHAEFEDEETESIAEESLQEAFDHSKIPDAGETVVPTEPGNKTKSERRMENFHFGNLRSTKGTQILRALRNILGEEKRVSGSHHIFEGKTGTTVPVPFHGDIPIGIGLLKKCLKKLGISPEELYKNI